MAKAPDVGPCECDCCARDIEAALMCSRCTEKLCVGCFHGHRCPINMLPVPLAGCGLLVILFAVMLAATMCIIWMFE